MQFNWGLLSTANINRSIITPIRSIPNNIVYAVGSRNKKKGKVFSEKWNINNYLIRYLHNEAIFFSS